MANQFDPTNLTSHLSKAEREAFDTDREKFRADNLQRVRGKLSDHIIQTRDRATGKEITVKTGLKLMGGQSDGMPKTRTTIPVDLTNLPDDNLEPDFIPELEQTSAGDQLRQDLSRDTERMHIANQVTYPADAFTPKTGPELSEDASEQEVLDYMEKVVEQKCGRGKLHPHLKESTDNGDPN